MVDHEGRIGYRKVSNFADRPFLIKSFATDMSSDEEVV